MTKLTKENFWNEMSMRYPNAMEHFLKWINVYKENVNWDCLFNSTEGDPFPTCDYEHKAPKYHELPIAIQLGIFYQFVHEWFVDSRYKGFKSFRHTQTFPMTKNFVDFVKDYIETILETIEELNGKLMSIETY